MSKSWAIAIMGPTAVGKSEIAERLAHKLDTRIINADAFQVYRGFDIGTAKPTDRSRYDLIDICAPDESFSAGKFVSLARPLIKSENIVVCGGTGLYVRALFDDFEAMAPTDPALRKRIKDRLAEIGPERLIAEHGSPDLPPDAVQNPVRLTRFLERLAAPSTEPKPYNWQVSRFKVGLELPKQLLEEKIRRRVENMVQNGFLREVEGLLAEGARLESPAFRAIGYRAMAEVVAGIATLDEAVERTVTRTRQYAKRQMTWLRKEPGLRWLDATASPGENISQILKWTVEE